MSSKHCIWRPLSIFTFVDITKWHCRRCRRFHRLITSSTHHSHLNWKARSASVCSVCSQNSVLRIWSAKLIQFQQKILEISRIIRQFLCFHFFSAHKFFIQLLNIVLFGCYSIFKATFCEPNSERENKCLKLFCEYRMLIEFQRQKRATHLRNTFSWQNWIYNFAPKILVWEVRRLLARDMERE